jgi:hypothetical protein
LSAAVYRLTARVLVLLAVLASSARAAEVTRVVSALDDENRFDFNLTLSWLHEAKSAFVKRESQADPATQTELIKDLKFSQSRDVLNLRMDFGILWDVGLHVEAPLVLADNRSLDFDQTAASGCVYPGDLSGNRPTCVDQNNSTLLRDGILPGAGMMTYGLNAQNNGQGFAARAATVFRGPTRKGFENLGLGITWAAFNQMRDDTRPTWTLGFDAKLDIFSDMRFNPASPGGNTAVGLGYHQFIWSTFVSKRFRHFDPYFGAWYTLPVRTNGSLYQEIPNGNQTAINPQQRAGMMAGFEQIAWENPRANQRVTVEFRGRAEEHFFGRSASELWEPLSGSSKCTTTQAAPDCRPGIDGNLGDTRFDPYSGVTETQQYASFGGDAGLNIQVGKYARFRGLFGLLMDMPHFITYAGAGVDRNKDGRVDSGDPTEANANYRDAIDAPGRRFKVEGTQIWSLFLEGSIMF